MYVYVKHPTRDPKSFIDPNAHVLGELAATIHGLALTDRFCVRPILAVAATAAYGTFEAMRTFLECLSTRNKLLLKQSLSTHHLVLWDPYTRTEIIY
jgi:hypothetical protein